MAKQINTRILLKYDTLANWQASAFNGTDATKYLKAGELAIVTLGSDVETNHPTNASNQHPLLFKVGDGVHKFDDLAWASALAADVYDWAKAANVKYEGQHIKFVDASGSVIKDLDLSEFVTAQEMLNDYLGDNLTALTTTAEKIVPAINELDAEIGNLDELNAALENPADLVTAINKTLAAVEAGGTGSVVTVGKDDTSSSETTYTVYQGGKIVGGEGSTIEVPKVATGSTNGTISVGTTEVAVKGLASAAYVTVDSLNATAKGYADAVEAKLPTSADYGVLTVTGKDAIKVTTGQNPEVSLALDASGNVALSQSETGLKAAIDLSAYRLIADDEDTQYHVEYDSTNKKIKLVAGADASKMEIPTDDFIKDGMISSVAISEDGKNLVITWNSDAGKDVTNIPLTELVDIMTGVDGTTIKVEVSADDKISAEVKTESIRDGHIATDAAIAETKLAQGVQTALGLARTALQSHQDINGKADKKVPAAAGNLAALDATGNLADSGKKAADFALAADLGDLAAKDTVGTADIDNNAITTEKLATTVATAISNGDTAFGWGNHAQAGYAIAENLHLVATSGEYGDLNNLPTLGALAAKDKITSDDFSDEEVFVFNCGSASTVL